MGEVSEEIHMEQSIRILVVDDADDLRHTYAQGLGLLGYQVEQARGGAEALARVQSEAFDAVILDLNMPGMDGLECLKSLREENKDVEVLIVTGFGTIPSAVEAMRLGAYDYIAKPFSFSELDQRLKRAMQARLLRWENTHLRGLLRDKYHYENMIGKSEVMQRVFRLIRQAAQSRSTVLLMGKSGTGKELVARAIHFNSPVAAGPMVPVDCGAITPSIIESELFGHVKGAFTGAMQAKDGLFRAARGGTIFFDEIGKLPLEMQAKLLRALQEREIRPVGSDRTVPVDVRVVAATLKDLPQEVKAGRFREDLFYRLNVIAIRIPALCEHKADIPLLLGHFLKRNASAGKRAVERVDGQAMQALLVYDWPGNIRELENVVERALALGQGPVVTLADLPPHIAQLAGGKVLVSGASVSEAESPLVAPESFANAAADMVVGSEDVPADTPLAPPPGNLNEAGAQNTLEHIERQAILATLRATRGDRAACTRILGIDKSTLYRKLKRYDFEKVGEEGFVCGEAASAEVGEK